VLKSEIMGFSTIQRLFLIRKISLKLVKIENKPT